MSMWIKVKKKLINNFKLSNINYLPIHRIQVFINTRARNVILTCVAFAIKCSKTIGKRSTDIIL